MLKALNIFNESIDNAKALSSLYSFLILHVKVPYSYDDLLRSQIVYSVSAFDKLLHDLIKFGIMACYAGKRLATSRYLVEPITLELHSQLLSAHIPPREVLFEQEIIRKLSKFSFQDPDKVSEGLSLIWDEKHKWSAIGSAMGVDPKLAKTTLKLIVNRRNAIVHESDIDPVTNTARPISPAETSGITEFLQKCGTAITTLVM